MKFLRNVCLIIVLHILKAHAVSGATPVLQDRSIIGKHSVVPKEPKSKKKKITFSEVSHAVGSGVEGILTFIFTFCPSTPPDKWKSADEYFPKPYNPNDRTY